PKAKRSVFVRKATKWDHLLKRGSLLDAFKLQISIFGLCVDMWARSHSYTSKAAKSNLQSVQAERELNSKMVGWGNGCTVERLEK
ncbi:hypothetical protein Ancab_014222, partial [Ancistrocladus abbreviatus]